MDDINLYFSKGGKKREIEEKREKKNFYIINTSKAHPNC
jgi:hypothetical protein